MSELPNQSETAPDPEIANLFDVIKGARYENSQDGSIWVLNGVSNNSQGRQDSDYSLEFINKDQGILIKPAKNFIAEIHRGDWKPYDEQ